MKKIITLCLFFSILISTLFCFQSFADPADPTMEEAMVIHWDFEGSTLEEKLSNKAPNGSASDSLILTTSENRSTVENGVAHIAHDANEYLSMTTSKTNAIGTKLIDLKNATVFVRWKMTGTISDSNTTPICLNHTSNKAKALYARGYVNGADNTFVLKMNDYGGSGIYAPSNVIKPNTYVSMAITYSYDAESGYTVTLYISDCDWADGDVSNQRSLVLATDAFNGALWVNNSELLFGKFKNKADDGTDFYFDDIRVFNKTLNETEIKNLASLHNNGAQLPQGATASDPSTQIRLISSVRSLDAAKVGYVISLSNSSPVLDGANVTKYETDTVYSSITVDGTPVNNTDGWYYFGVILSDIPLSAYDQTIYCRSYMKMKDGSVIYGDLYSFTANQMFGV